MITDTERRALNRFVSDAGSQAVAARRLGVSIPYISLMVNGKRRIPDRVLAMLGLRRETKVRRSKRT